MNANDKLVICTECSKPIRASRLEDHIKRAHQLSKTAMADGRVLVVVPPELQVQVQTRKKIKQLPTFSCPVCKNLIAPCELEKHMASAHGRPFTPLTYRAPVAPPPRFSGDGVVESSGQDVFDRCIVYSGGGYGLGKNRHH